jgi:hypothetical protein
MFIARPLHPILNALPAARSRADRISSATSSSATWGRTNLAAAYKRAFRPSPTATSTLGHAKAIYLDFGLADEFLGHINPRFDDTNPRKEETEYVDSIKDSVWWLGYHWDGLYYASDYFDQLYEWAIQHIKAGKVYLDDLSADEIREYRRTLIQPGKESCCRKSRSIRAHACRRISRRLTHVAGEDRHGFAQPEHARSRELPHPARRASPHRKQVVHISDVRLRLWSIGFD